MCKLIESKFSKIYDSIFFDKVKQLVFSHLTTNLREFFDKC